MEDVNYKALGMLNILIEDGEAWISTIELAKALNRPHRDIMKSCRRLKDNLEKTVNDIKISKHTKDYLRTYECRERSAFLNSRKESYFLINRPFVTDILSRYELTVRSTVQSIFWNVADGLRNKGHDIKNIDELNVAVLEEFGGTMKGFEEKVMFDDEDALSDLDFWNTFRLLLKMIPSNVSNYMYRNFSFFRDFKDETSFHGDPEIQRDIQVINHLKAKGRL